MNLAVSFKGVLFSVFLIFNLNSKAYSDDLQKVKSSEGKSYRMLVASLQSTLLNQSGDNPGIGIILRHDDQVIFEAVKGMASKHKSITLNTGFRIGSLSKPFTALAIMQLDEMKKLKVNDSVVKYIRELNGSWQQVTIEDLLTHRVSLSQDLFEDNNLRLANKATNKELISFVNQKSNVPKLMAKGKAQYCNSCYVLLAEIVARVSKMSFAEYMKRNF
ncbi:MAG: beta-lactamase family protein, partial [Kangiellaceae bacterium]|nr:beta-lactamase family protein [Kangiellaceae bacterium]